MSRRVKQGDDMDKVVGICRNKELLFKKVKVAGDFGTRLRGLMFYRAMPGIDGLLLSPCKMAHLFWMRFPLDLIYLSRDKVVVFLETKYPNELGRFVKNAYYVLETVAGTSKTRKIRAGDRFDW